jgi:mono/diheme cytochrome c family protein
MKSLMAIAVGSIVAGLLATAASAQTPPAALLARGNYLVNVVMSCNNCHTPMGPNGPDLSRALSGGLTFDEIPFKVTASNITPDKETGIGAWSDAALKAFLRTGVRPNGVATAPIMPTAFYSRMTPGDLDAIVAYLRSIPAIHRATPPPDYRAVLPHVEAPYAGQPMAESDMTDLVTRGTYLASLAHCLECHTPMASGGAKDYAQSAGKGGTSFNGPWGTSVSANITPAGLGDWSDAEIRRALTQGISRDGRKLKPPMGFAAYARTTSLDQDALIAFLRTLPAVR